MTTYAIGDIQGCYDPLQRLLEKMQFDPSKDTLWFTGDLVNRGPASLAVLRFVYALGEKHQTVLGNHDLHLLAVASGTRKQHDSDTLDDILNADDKDDLLVWLQNRPLLVEHDELSYVMTHAGLAPSWPLEKARQLAREVEAVLQRGNTEELFRNMYGNQPDHWDDKLQGTDRLRCIINYFTRMRFCHRDGRLDLSYKGTIEGRHPDLMPWFDVEPRANKEVKIIFGHWAALNGKVDAPNLYALDTGCVWGNKLTAMRLEDGERISVAA